MIDDVYQLCENDEDKYVAHILLIKYFIEKGYIKDCCYRFVFLIKIISESTLKVCRYWIILTMKNKLLIYANILYC